jgi:putative transposase
MLNESNGSVNWQRNYYEHIVRCEDEFIKIRNYIRGNPANWHLDKENPINWK